MAIERAAHKKNEIILYQPDSSIQLEVLVENETVWLSLNQITVLFDRDKSVISRHIKNIFSEGELPKDSVVANFATTAIDGKTYIVDYYNLDVIISVGYRVKSIQGTQFRQWANRILREYILKGYAINQRFERIDDKLFRHEQKLLEHQKQIDFFVRTSLPPVEGVFYNGQIFDAYKAEHTRPFPFDRQRFVSYWGIAERLGKKAVCILENGDVGSRFIEKYRIT